MKKIITPMLTLAIAACSSSGDKEVGSQDSMTISDTITATSLVEEEPILKSQADVARFYSKKCPLALIIEPAINDGLMTGKIPIPAFLKRVSLHSKKLIHDATT
jgi:hypothetical protein